MFSSGLYANVTATLALVIALSGTSYAAITITGKDIRNNTITGADIKDGTIRGADIAGSTITSAKVRNQTLLAGDFKAGQLPAGAPGATGPAGTSGSANVIVNYGRSAAEVPVGASAVVAMPCAAGQQAINGGMTIAADAFRALTSAATGGAVTPGSPSTANPTGWRVEATNIAGAPNYLQTYVVCLAP